MLNPVATQTLIPIEEYMRTAYEPDAEFVGGEIVERNLGENPHSAAQVRLVEIFYELRKKHPVYCRTELRMRLAPARIRIPDVAIFHPKEPTELVPSDAPLVIVEIVYGFRTAFAAEIFGCRIEVMVKHANLPLNQVELVRRVKTDRHIGFALG